MGDPSHSDWLGQWQAFARQYSNAWQDLARGAGPSMAPAAAVPGIDAWTRMFSAQGAQGVQGETVERLADSARSYAAFLQSALDALGGANGTPAWGDAMLRSFSPEATGAASFAPPFAALADAFRAAMRPPDVAGDAKAWLNLPAFGPMREHQEHQRDSMLAAIEYQEQLRRYNALMMKAAQRGFELFQGKLSEREQPGRQLDSLRALYDLWVDAAEEGYAEVALSSEFREAYGALVNAQMRMRSLLSNSVEQVASELGMPTRSEVDSIGERLQALRREVRAAGGARNQGLAAEVADLRGQVAELGNALRRSAARDLASPPTRAPASPAAAEAAPARATATTAKPRGTKARAKPAKASPKRAGRTQARKPAAPVAKRSMGENAKGNFAARIASFADASREAPQPGALRGRRDKH
ncbi:MAG: class III poly(R)-hydroxyalkanoic acid synthase subunit PhaE [Lysobacteraceae bacterium]|nr:MAG: class III poly(R)-hydroxyalkanoic acid synthase subunit PhaE [Xanthomonadaceae bacterium]